MSFNQLDYCQYLLSSQNNYTLTNLAKHFKNVSHDTINRYLVKYLDRWLLLKEFK